MQTRDEFIEAFEEVVGDAYDLTNEDQVLRWINQAPAQLDFYRERTVTLEWDAEQTEVALPDDFYRPRTFHGYRRGGTDLFPDTDLYPSETLYPGRTGSEWMGEGAVPPYRIWGGKLRFKCDPEEIEGGSIMLDYLAHWPAITEAAASVMPETANQAALSFALYRFFTRLAGSRAMYRRYATLINAHGVDIRELADLAQDHLDAFDEARGKLETPSEPVYYYNC